MPAKGGPLDLVAAILGAAIMGACLAAGVLHERNAELELSSWIALAGGCFIFFVSGAIVQPLFASARAAASSTACGANLKSLHTGVSIYSSDNNDLLPLATTWQDGIRPHLSEFPRCPRADAPFTYGFNVAAGGMKLDSASSDLVLLFEMDSDVPNAHGGALNLMANRHGAPRYITVERRLLPVANKKQVWSPTPLKAR